MKDKQITQIKEYKGGISRIKAEEILSQQKIGSYLLRDLDETAQNQIELLEKENQISIDGVVLTYLQEDGKIGEILLIKEKGYWEIYSDEVDLKKAKGYGNKDLKDLIQTLQSLNFQKTT